MDYKEALKLVIEPGLALLPQSMDSPEARVMLLTIGMQESRFKHRKQINGPARGFFQFELLGGIKGVLNHQATNRYIYDALIKANVPNNKGPLPMVCYDCLAEPEYDALATVFARLLLYTHPKKLPTLNSDPSESWKYYADTWRPGRPHRETWDSFLMHAREAVNV